MKRIPNNVVDDLARLVPRLIDFIPEADKRNTRVYNTIRLARKAISKLKTLKDVDDGK